MKNLAISIMIFLMLTFLTSIGYAKTITVPGDQPTIAAGIAAADQVGDIVEVAAGTYNEGDLTINVAITVRSVSGAAVTTIDCGGLRGFLIDGVDATISGFTIMNGNLDDGRNGAAIGVDNASPLIVNNILKDNTVTNGNGGGAIFCQGGAAQIIGNIITGNSTSAFGGGICFAGGATLSIINNTITENSAAAGGGIAALAGNADVLNSIVWNNTATSQGGDIFAALSRVVNISYSDLGVTGGAGTINPGDGMLDDVDPLFAGGGDYHITDYSPCIGAGTSAGLPPEAATDIDGDSRPNPALSDPDIGADEHFRDVPLAVALSAFTATSNGNKIILRWRTESEINNLGFKVYRSTKLDGDYVKVTPAIIAGAGTEGTPREYSFTDEDVVVDNTYYYYIENIDFSGKTSKSHIIEVKLGKQTITRIIPIKSSLFQNFPNPFNPETWIPYQLAQNASVIVRIYNLKGRTVRTIELGEKDAGIYLTKDKAVYWDGRDDSGEKVASGVYFYTLKAGDFTATKRMVIVE